MELRPLFDYRSHALKPVSLRLLLVVPFVLQLSAAVGMTGYFAWCNGQKAVQDLAGQLRGEVSDRIDQHLDDYLEIPQHIVAINADAFNSGILDVDPPANSNGSFGLRPNIKRLATSS